MRGWASSSKVAKDDDNFSDNLRKSISVNEEYLHAFRTHSYIEFFTKAQLLVNEPLPSSPRSSINKMDILLEPEQHIIPPILESFSQNSSNLKNLMLHYFETSAQASRICSKLLRSINETQTNFNVLQRILHYSSEQYKSAIAELDSFSQLRSPFADPNPEDFKQICDNFSSILNCLKSKRKKTTRRIKLIEFIKKASGVCLTVACSVCAVIAIGIAVHSISGLVIGPAIMGLSPNQFKNKTSSLNCFKCKYWRKLRKQIDFAAKGTYILNRDFDTVSRIVARLHDEIEHKKEMIRFSLERREDKFPLEEVVKELRKNERWFTRQVEELEEHVCLCLVTINRARVLVIKEMMSKP
ncbi:uncharacterized protein A4U43_C09F1750 [Asparagus officinalis]|uniref:Uncharacterized protein n=1 Tax=Asparagus officinalis TaxID=4686 RepID=A0A5P1E4S0_ASPOF|nr:UPF0496 protein At1g20180-like [Asparagus officinalis]ONK57560.1 uncharacterized protein A4U43_C09F1750 [Asparagus officinalis]